MTKIYSYLIIVFTLLYSNIAFAAGGQGIFLISDCNSITSPVPYATWCVQSSASDPNIKYWNGTSYIPLIGNNNVIIANSSSIGTVLNTLTKLIGAPSTAQITMTTDANGAIGITIAGAGTTGNATIAQSGIQSCIFDGGTVAGDYIQISTSVAGDCHDVGPSLPIGEILGRSLSTNASGGAYAMLLTILNNVTANFIYTHTLTGATPVLVTTSASVAVVDVENETLSANITSITTPAASAMADGEIIHAKFIQPSGSNNYTLPGSFTPGSGTTVVLTTGCPVMPSMPTGTNHSALFDMIYNASITELDVVSCPTAGS